MKRLSFTILAIVGYLPFAQADTRPLTDYHDNGYSHNSESFKFLDDPYYAQTAYAAINRIPTAYEDAVAAATTITSQDIENQSLEGTPLETMHQMVFRALSEGFDTTKAYRVGQLIFWDRVKPYLDEQEQIDKIKISNYYYQWNIEIQKYIEKHSDLIMKDKVVLESREYKKNFKLFYDSGISFGTACIQAYEKTKIELGR